MVRGVPVLLEGPVGGAGGAPLGAGAGALPEGERLPPGAEGGNLLVLEVPDEPEVVADADPLLGLRKLKYPEELDGSAVPDVLVAGEGSSSSSSSAIETRPESMQVAFPR